MQGDEWLVELPGTVTLDAELGLARLYAVCVGDDAWICALADTSGTRVNCAVGGWCTSACEARVFEP